MPQGLIEGELRAPIGVKISEIGKTIGLASGVVYIAETTVFPNHLPSCLNPSFAFYTRERAQGIPEHNLRYLDPNLIVTRRALRIISDDGSACYKDQENICVEYDRQINPATFPEIEKHLRLPTLFRRVSPMTQIDTTTQFQLPSPEETRYLIDSRSWWKEI